MGIRSLRIRSRKIGTASGPASGGIRSEVRQLRKTPYVRKILRTIDIVFGFELGPAPTQRVDTSSCPFQHLAAAPRDSGEQGRMNRACGEQVVASVVGGPEHHAIVVLEEQAACPFEVSDGYEGTVGAEHERGGMLIERYP